MTSAIPRMAAFERRRLTPGEVALAYRAFAGELDYQAVRLVQTPNLFPGAMVPLGATIVFGAWRAARDFAQAGDSEQGWLIHELAHVWQATRRGVVLAAAKLSCLLPRDYAIRLAPGRRFDDLNIEAQAEIARYVWHARCGRRLSPIATDQLEALWPISAPDSPPDPPSA